VAGGKFESVASGKTALGEAISRTLLGIKGRFAQTGYYCQNGKGSTYVSVACAHKGKDLTVDMGYKVPELNKTGEALRFTYAGQQVWRDRIGHTREDLVKLLTVPPKLAEWTVWLDGDGLIFDSLSHQSSVELLMSALAQPPWTDFLKQANTTVHNLKRQLAVTSAKHDNLVGKCSELEIDIAASRAGLAQIKSVYETALAENAKKFSEASEELKAKKGTLASHQTRMAELKLAIKKNVELTSAKCHALEIERNRRADQLSELKESLASACSDRGHAQMNYDKAARILENTDSLPKDCPTCGRPMQAKHSKAALDAAVAAKNAAAEELNRTDKIVADKKAQVNEAKTLVNEADQQLEAARDEAPVATLSREYEDLESKNGRINARINQLVDLVARLSVKPDNSAIIRAETQLAERERNYALTLSEIKASAAEVVDDQEALRVAEYWQTGFGPGGIPNMILNDAIEPLNETSKRISSVLTNNCIRVIYETCRALVSGQEKAELNIRVENPSGASRAEGVSKGERSLTNLIIAETLAEVGGVANRIGYRWYDEISPNADEICRRSTFAYIKELVQRYKILAFIVDHSPEAASFADYVLTAEKTSQGTLYHWD
jgi:hypothetical protein